MKKKNKSLHYTPVIPKTISVRELQRQYKLVREELNKEGTLMVMNYSEPDMVVMSKEHYQNLLAKITKLKGKYEIADILHAYTEARLAEKNGTLIQADSLADLIEK